MALSILVGLLVTALAGSREIWLDEMQSIVIARLPWSEKWRFVVGDAHPPLYFYLLSVWSTLFGESPVSFRSLSVVAHSVGGLAMFAVARRHLGGDRIGLLCCALFLLSPALFYYGSETRMYAVANVWMVATLGLFLDIRAGSRSRRTALALGVTASLAFYSHYVALFAIAGLMAYWLVVAIRDRTTREPLAWSVVSFGVLSTPLILLAIAQQRRTESLLGAEETLWTDPASLSYGAAPAIMSLGERAAALVENAASILGAYPAENPLVLAVVNVPVLVMLGLTLMLFLRRDEMTWLALAATIATLVGTQLWGLSSRRYFLMLAPFGLLVFGRGLAWMLTRPGTRRLAPALGVALLGLYAAGSVRVLNTPQPHPTEHVVDYLEDNYAPEDLVVFNALWGQVPFDYYAERAGFAPTRRGFPVTVYDWWEQQPTKSWGSHVITKDDLDAFVAEVDGSVKGTVWVVAFEHHTYDPHLQLVSALEARRSVRQCDIVPEGEPPTDRFRLFGASREAKSPCR